MWIFCGVKSLQNNSFCMNFASRIRIQTNKKFKTSMKSRIITSLLFTAAQIGLAKDYVLDIKPTNPLSTGHTEVTIRGIGSNPDTLTVIPGKDISHIQVAVSDTKGNKLSDDVIPTIVPQTYRMSLPDMPNGCILEIRDNKGVIYENYEE